MDKSIFNLIKQAIITHSSKDVTIHERPLATELIESEKKDDLFSPYDFLPKNYIGKKLILTRYLLYIGRIFVLFHIAIIYAIYDLLHRIITGDWKSEKLSDKFRMKQNLSKKWNKKLHTNRWRGIQTSSGLNSLVFVFVLTLSVHILVWGFHFLIKEVVLPDNNSQINSYGVVSIDQGCLEEQYFFLLNSANFWTNSGIAVTEGDEVFITASGSMYSDVKDMKSAAEENRKMQYSRSNFICKYDTIEIDAEYCIYGRYPKDTIILENKPAYGSLLYQICDEIRGPQSYNTENHPNAVKQINFGKNRKDETIERRYSFEAEKSGLLYFTFNDILLDSQMINTITDSINTSPNRADLIDIYTKCHKESELDTIKWLKENVDSLLWFEDNFGEALINIRVVKNISNSQLDYLQKSLVLLYRFQRWLYTDTEESFWKDFSHSGLLKLMLIVLGWFIFDMFICSILNRKFWYNFFKSVYRKLINKNDKQSKI